MSFRLPSLCTNASSLETFRIQVIHISMDQVYRDIQFILLTNLFLNGPVYQQFPRSIKFVCHGLPYVLNWYVPVIVINFKMSRRAIKRWNAPSITRIILLDEAYNFLSLEQSTDIFLQNILKCNILFPSIMMEMLGEAKPLPVPSPSAKSTLQSMLGYYGRHFYFIFFISFRV